jgi:hypothetical protein
MTGFKSDDSEVGLFHPAKPRFTRSCILAQESASRRSSTGRGGISALVAHDIDDGSIRVPDKKPSHAPWFISQWIHHGKTLPLSGRVTSIDVGDFNTDVGVRFTPGIGRHDADLGRRIGWRGEGDNPSHVHGDVEPENSLVKRPRRGRIGGVDIGDDSSNAHGRIMFGLRHKPVVPARTTRRDRTYIKLPGQGMAGQEFDPVMQRS